MADQEQLWKHWEGPQSSDRPSDNKLCWYTGVCPAYTIGLPYKGDADQTWAEAEGQQYLVMVRSEQIAWTQHVPVHFDLVERIDFVRKDWHEE